MQVRRAAAALVVALVRSNPEKIGALYAACRPALTKRFTEREESVKLDVFNAVRIASPHVLVPKIGSCWSGLFLLFRVFLSRAWSSGRKQRCTCLHGARASSEQVLLHMQYAALVRAAELGGAHSAADAAADATLLVRHLKTRSMPLKTGVFAVLRTLVDASSAHGFHGAVAAPAAEAALRDGSSSNAFKTEVLKFLQAALQPAALGDWAPSLKGLAGGLDVAANDKYYKVRT